MGDKKQTPMMRQYQHLKDQYKNKILLFQMGDFFETFGKDAETISKVLDIALTTRDKDKDPTPLAGFPLEAIDQHLPKLVKAGYNVAVAEQVEDPKHAKGIVRREITRIVSPGTLTIEEEKENNFLAAVFADKNTYGVAQCDLSTGEFKLTELSGLQSFKTEISRIRPKEILVSPKQKIDFLSNFTLQPVDDYSYKYESAKELLTDQLNAKNLNAFGIEDYEKGVIAAGAIVHYLKEIQKNEISHISKIQYYSYDGTMVLDTATLGNLDLVSETKEHSIVHILDKTATSMGARKLRQWLFHPLIDSKSIKNRLNCVEAFFSDPKLLKSTNEMLKQISDLERLSSKIGLNRANARDLINLSESIANTESLEKHLQNRAELSKLIKVIQSNKSSLRKLTQLIEESIKPNPPQTITEGDFIKGGYSKEVDEIREGSSDSRKWIKNLEKEERERTGIPSLKVKSNKVFGYFIEITNTHKDKVPENYVRKQTLVNSERYITKELKEKEDIVLNAHEKLAELEYKCFLEIREKLLEFIPAVQEVSECIAKIDTYCSLAESARVYDYTRPEIHEMGEKNGLLKIKNGRHPVVEQNITEEFINNDIEIDTEKQRLQILTGPNMSGKSTYIRQTALIVLLAQIGSFVPAASAEISIVDRIFTRVGASDELSSGRSTFMVEMDEAANIINNATRHSLIILDEVGRGTSTYDGVSIAWAIAEHIHNNLRARCLFATHYHELLKLESELEGVKNYNVAVLEEEEKIVFLRKIEEGGTDRSYGIYVAHMAGLPEDLISRAREILDGFEQENMFGLRSEVRKRSEEENGNNSQNIDKSKKPKSSGQISMLMQENSPKLSENEKVLKEIAQLNLNSLSPIQAFKFLEKLKNRIR